MSITPKQQQKYETMQRTVYPLFSARLGMRRAKLIHELNTGGLGDYQSSFEKAVEEAVSQTLVLQEFQNKGEIRYLYFSFLLSNSLSGETLVKIDCGGELGAADVNEIDCYWNYGNLFDYIDEDVQYFEKELKKTIPRMKEYEIHELKTAYLIANYRTLEEILKYFIRFGSVKKIISPIKNRTIHVLYGPYLAESEVIGTL